MTLHDYYEWQQKRYEELLATTEAYIGIKKAIHDCYLYDYKRLDELSEEEAKLNFRLYVQSMDEMKLQPGFNEAERIETNYWLNQNKTIRRESTNGYGTTHFTELDPATGEVLCEQFITLQEKQECQRQ